MPNRATTTNKTMLHSRWRHCALAAVLLLSLTFKTHALVNIHRITPAAITTTRRITTSNPALRITNNNRQHSTQLLVLPVDVMDSTSHFLSAGVASVIQSIEIPFKELGEQLAQSLDIGSGLTKNVATSAADVETTSAVLESLGYDALVFLAASVIVTPLCRALAVTPILGYLIIGAILGPNCLNLFSNTEAALELGDVGIMFLLFSEGLEVTTPRLQKLVNYLPLGIAQISLVTAIITATIMSSFPNFVNTIIPLEPTLLHMPPTEAVVLAMIGCLSTSAFIFPVLKERGWEEEESGEAATSILLLQDLLVAPLLVLLPYLAGDSATDYTAIAFLTLKATLGFGSVLALGSFVLQKIFQLVAAAQSSETFVALCLLVAAGMGVIAKYFGLTDTAGAFAAGVLLANTNYRAQIQADILPFKGILLGIFFMDAGSNFNLELVQNQWAAITIGSLSLILAKFLTLGAATRAPRWMEPNRLPAADAMRVSLLLAGGGEFAFVVLALSESLGIVSATLSSTVTAIVLITMGLTPVLGQLAEKWSEPLLAYKDEEKAQNRRYKEAQSDGNKIDDDEHPLVATDAVVVCGYGEVGQNVLRVLDEAKSNHLIQTSRTNTGMMSNGSIQISPPTIVAFDVDPSLFEHAIRPGNSTIVLYGDAANAAVIKSSGIEHPSAIFVTYEDSGRVESATARLRAAFYNTPIFARASTRAEVFALELAGATEVIIESDELARASTALISGVWGGNLEDTYDSPEHFQAEAAAVAGISIPEVKDLLRIYESMDQDLSGRVCPTEIEAVIERSSRWIANDDEIRSVELWIEATLKERSPVNAMELCHLYGEAPQYVKKAFGIARKPKKQQKKQQMKQKRVEKR